MRRMITSKQQEFVEDLNENIIVKPDYIQIGEGVTILNNYTVNGRIIFNEDVEFNVPFKCSGLIWNYCQLIEPTIDIFIQFTQEQREQLNTLKPSTIYFSFPETDMVSEFSIITNRRIWIGTNIYEYASDEEAYVLSDSWVSLDENHSSLYLTMAKEGFDYVELLNL